MVPELPPKHAALIEAEKCCHAIRARRREVEAKLLEIESAQPRENFDLDDLAAIAEVSDPRADLQHQLDLLNRAGRKARLRLTNETERHNREILRAFRPAHRAATRRILKAVEALIEANKGEEMVRRACPVGLIVATFPHIGQWDANHVGVAQHWQNYVRHAGLLELEPKPKPAPKKRGLFGGKSNGSAAEAAPALAAKACG